MKQKEDITLPANIKLEIKNSVATLKTLLKDDNEFLIKLMGLIANVGKDILAQNMASVVFVHYDDIIKQCAKDYKPWPDHVTKVRTAVDTLSYLVSGGGKLIFDAVKDLESKNMDEDCKILGKLARIEIGHEFNPEVDYHINEEFFNLCYPELLGQTSAPLVDDETI